MKNPVPLRCDLHGSIPELPAFFARFEAWAQAGGLPAGLAAQLGLMLDEWLTNVALHAYGGKGGPVSVQVEFVAPHTLQCVVRDHGPEFDPTRLPSPNLESSLEEREIGGLGVHFLRQLADRFSYRRDGDCNELTLSYTASGRRNA